MITTAPSKTITQDALKDALQFLSKTENCPEELVAKVQLAMQSITFENDAQRYWSHWLAANGAPNLESPDSAQQLFCAGFNFCQEEMGYAFEGE